MSVPPCRHSEGVLRLVLVFASAARTASYMEYDARNICERGIKPVWCYCFFVYACAWTDGGIFAAVTISHAHPVPVCLFVSVLVPACLCRCRLLRICIDIQPVRVYVDLIVSISVSTPFCSGATTSREYERRWRGFP